MTYKDFKSFLETLSEDQLQQKVVVEVLDDRVCYEVYAGVVEEDIYMVNGDPEDCGTLTELKDIYADEFDQSKCTLATKKGIVFISAE